MLSRNFRLQKVGDLSWLENNYNFSHISFSIDELIVLDVTRGGSDIELFSNVLKSLVRGCFVPIAAGGGIRSTKDAQLLLRSGADKVVVNTPIFTNPKLVEELAMDYGEQCVVASVDLKRTTENGYKIWINNGQQCLDNQKVEKSLEIVVSAPVGEIYLNSMDQDGTGQGYDLNTLDLLPENLSKPVILAGGVGNSSHLKQGLDDSRVDAVATAHLFNFVGDGLKQARNTLIQNGYQLPFWDTDLLPVR